MDKNINIILGGVSVEASLRDGSKEEVKVRQLPIELIQRWSSLQGDESALVELYCDKEDKLREANIASTATLGQRLTNMLETASVEDAVKITTELQKVRERMIELNAEPRWASRLTPESHEQIVKLGEELNTPLFQRWARDRRTALETITALTKELTLETSPQPAA